MNQAEALVVTEGPFEIVEKGPDMVAPHRHAPSHRPPHRGEMALEIGDAVGILHLARLKPVGGGHAVLGHDERQTAGIALVNAEQDVAETLGMDLQPIRVRGRGPSTSDRPGQGPGAAATSLRV